MLNHKGHDVCVARKDATASMLVSLEILEEDAAKEAAIDYAVFNEGGRTEDWCAVMTLPRLKAPIYGWHQPVSIDTPKVNTNAVPTGETPVVAPQPRPRT